MDDRKISARQAWADRWKERRGALPPLPPTESRLPMGQHVTSGLPVLDLGIQPEISVADWSFSVGGAVEHELQWDWQTFTAQPQRSVTVDIHCVTTWSSYDNDFAGVPLAHVLDCVQPKPTATFVMAYGYDGYSTNLPLEFLCDDDALLCHSWRGQPLDQQHGGPVRLLVPRLYFWKSAKWLRHLQFLEEDHPGFWEQRGYHMRGEPFAEERFG